jgi:selenocysteine-specific translation elongation factor
MLDVNDITAAVEKRYTDFSNAIKQELNNKLQNHPIIQNHSSEFERIERLKDIFSQINQTKHPD